MAKHNRQLTQKGRDHYEASESYEDQLLPSAAEIAEYSQADPELPALIRQTAQDEQKHRHKMNAEGVTIGKREQILVHGLNYFKHFIVLLIALGGMWFSYELLKMGFEIQGSIFSGGTLLAIIYALLKKNPPKTN
ncbi:hypothetical protein EP331_09670 [bacterium]|nr:MAG: hypothetical protein EP331_09670 [bacterium]